jgi:starch phosphorylase
MRESMAQLTPAYSANRTVREYTEDHYLPGAAAYSARAAENGKLGMDVLDWQRKLSAGWTHLAFGPLKVESHGGRHSFEVVVYLGGIEPDGLLVEMFADGHNGEQPKRTTMNRVTESSDGGFVYAATVESGRDANDFTPRVIPYHQGVSVPLEASQILWQR